MHEGSRGLRAHGNVGRFCSAVAFAAVALTLFTGSMAAQARDNTLLAHYPLNPMSVSRSGLFTQPYVEPGTGWTYSLVIDYASSVEWEESVTGALYVLDAELMRTMLTARRNISGSRFVQFGLDVNGAFNGFADGAFDWYHSTIGITFRGREMRPRNEFGYSISTPLGIRIERERPDYYLGDLRLGYGIRHGGSNQTTLAASLPTGTAPEGYAKGTYSIGAIHTWRRDLMPRVGLEATFGAGFTPRHGELSVHQLTLYNSGSAAVTVGLFGSNVLYGSLFTHSALYDHTSLPELENREWSGDFGWMGRTSSGRTWRLGFTEDFGPADAGIDLVLRFGMSW